MANVSSSNGLEKRPKLRFPGFDGPIKSAHLSQYLVENKERNKNLIYTKSDVLSVSGEYGIVNQIEFQGRSFAGESVAEYHVVETNDIVYTKSPLKANPYGIIKVNNGAPGIVSTLYAVYHPCEGTVAEYIDYYFGNDLRLNKYLKPLVNIGAKHDMKVNNETVLTGEVYFPGYSEQKKIVGFLTILDERIRQQRNLVEALKKYKRGLQNRFFFKHSELSPKASEFDSRDVKPLGSVVHINPKTGALPEAFIYIDLECVESGVLNSKKLLSRNSAPSRAQRLLEEGDLLYQMVRPYQKNNYYFQKNFEYPTVASTGYAQIRCSEVDTQFIYEQLSSDYFAREAMLRSTGTGYPAINADDLAEIPIWIPPLDQQEKIGAALSFLGAKIEVHQKLLSALCTVKSSLLQQLFI